MGFLRLRRPWGFSHESRRGPQGASRAVPGNSCLHAHNLSEPTATTALPQPQADCLAAARRSLSLEVTMPFLQVPITWRSIAPPGGAPYSGFPPAENWLRCPLVSRLAVTMTTAWPRAWMTPDLTPLPASPKSVWVPAAFVGLRFACQFEAALLLIGFRGWA